MRELIINKKDSGQRLDKLLMKYLDKAPSSFIYKMLRKKNIKLNNCKATGKELLSENDIIHIYISDESLQNFRNEDKSNNYTDNNDSFFEPSIVFENDDIIIAVKPVGVLSQKAAADDVSMNEICLNYLHKKNDPCIIGSNTFKPSICNRLDRNTEGLIIFAKTYSAANIITASLRDRTIHKYYYCVVNGIIDKGSLIEGYIVKDKSTNRVKIYKEAKENSSYIKTGIRPIKSINNKTLLEIELFTGKTHQIRAHLASIGHPIIGDYKYGKRSINDYYHKTLGLDHQLLFAYKIVMPQYTDSLSDISEKQFVVKLPKIYEDVLNVNMEDPRTKRFGS